MVAKGVTALCLLLKITRARRLRLRPRTTFAHTCAYGERVNAARYYVAIAERKHIVRHLCRAMGCLSKSRRFFPSVREKSVSMNNLSPRAEKSTSRNRHRERGAMLRASCGTGKEGAFRSSEVGAMPAAVRRYRTNEGSYSRSKVEPRCPRLYAVSGVKARFFICGRTQSGARA